MTTPILCPPRRMFVFSETESYARALSPVGSDRLVWESKSAQVTFDAKAPGRLGISLSSGEPVRRLVLRWSHSLGPNTKILGDTWERSYADLEWRGPTPDRSLPWYFLATCESETVGWGVQTGARAITSWRVDADGITMELDVRSGGVGVDLRSRVLDVATIVQRLPQPGESPFAAARAFCKIMCPAPLMPGAPIVGHNDWYWLYGKNSAAQILDATRRLLDLYPSGNDAPRPWSVIDDGWQVDKAKEYGGMPGGPWDGGNANFPDMAGLAAEIKSQGARPGVWLRPLFTYGAVPESWTIQSPLAGIPPQAHRLDPTVPGVIEQVREDIARLRAWGFDLIKHDFSTFDVTGRWGFEMHQTGFAADGWHFADRTRTTAEVITDLYRTIREAAGPEVLVLGCNTVSHLAAGLVDIQRIGDDTSASDWARTRRMGVNTLAFRAAQHGAFYAADADCVPVGPSVPWPLTEQWLKLVASSGTPLFLSLDPAALGIEQKAILRKALADAAKSAPVAEPLDWLDSPIPSRWKLLGKEERFGWSEWD